MEKAIEIKESRENKNSFSILKMYHSILNFEYRWIKNNAIAILNIKY